MPNPNPIVAVYSRSGYPSGNIKLYTSNYAGTAVNILIVASVNGYKGGIVYNDPPNYMFDSSGQYVGDQNWPNSLRQLMSATNIAGIYFSLSNSGISTLAAMSAPALASVMQWLKANGIAGIDMDCEYWGQEGGLKPMDPACQTVTTAAIGAGLGLTAAPYNRQNEWGLWCSFVTQNGGSVSWLNIQCYAGGVDNGNDPVQWFNYFSPSVPVAGGFEAKPGSDKGALTPSQAKLQVAAWQAEPPPNCLAGAFVWEFGIIISGSYTVADYATAMYAGLTGN